MTTAVSFNTLSQIWSAVSQEATRNFEKLSTRHKFLTCLALAILGCTTVIVFFRSCINKFTLIEKALEHVRSQSQATEAVARTTLASNQGQRIPQSASSASVTFATPPPVPEQNLKVLRLRALRQMNSGSLSHKLHTYLKQASQFTESVSSIWMLTTFYLLNDAYQDDADCHSKLKWSECDEYACDSFSSLLEDGTTIWRVDALNDANHQTNALSLKREMLPLSAHDKEAICEAIISPALALTLEPAVGEVYLKIQAMSQVIRAKYQVNLTVIDGHLLYIESPRDKIHEILKAILLREHHVLSADDVNAALLESTFAKNVCEESVRTLLSFTSVEGNTLNFKNGHLLYFKQVSESIPNKSEDLKQISLFEANDLTSKNMVEKPFISHHALKIAQHLHDGGDEFPAEIQHLLDEFVDWFYKNYYLDFCARFARQIYTLEPPPLPEPPVQSDTTQGGRKVIINDRYADNFMRYLNKKFDIGHSWSYSGSCFLACFIPESRGAANYEGIMQMRAQISALLQSQVDQYLDYVNVIPGYVKNEEDDYWAVSQDDSLESKRAAILKRCQDILQPNTKFREVEFSLTAHILQRPIHIYKRCVDRFNLDEKDQLLPQSIYGENFRDQPSYLLDDYDHYKPLKLKSP
jgi:hypothetical protein